MPGSIAAALALAGCSEGPRSVDACSYSSLQAAINHARPGSIVTICPGRYDESVRIDKALTLSGASSQEVLFCGGAGTAPVISVDAVSGPVTIESITIRPSSGSAAQAGIGIVGSGSVAVHDVTVDWTNLVSAGSASPPVYGIDVDTSLVELAAIQLQNIPVSTVGCAGLHVHGDSVASVTAVMVDSVACAGVLTSDAMLSVTGGTIHGAAIGVDTLSGEVHLDGLTISDARIDALAVSGGELHATGLTLARPQRYGVLGLDGLVSLQHTTIDQPEDGIHTLLGTVVAADSTITQPRGTAIYVGDAGLVVFGPGTVAGGRDGVSVVFPTGEVSLVDASVVDSLEHGISLLAGQVMVSGGSIERAGHEGVLAQGGSLLLADFTVKDSMADGVLLTGTTSATLANVTVTGSAGWGVSCDGGSMAGMSSVMLESCVGRFAGNTMGGTHLFNGCQTLYTCVDTGP